MLFGAMSNYPTISFFCIWFILLALAYIEQSDWRNGGVVYRFIVLALWALVFYFMYPLSQQLGLADEIALPVSIGAGVLLAIILVIHFQKSRELHPGTKLVWNVLLVVMFFLVFLF